MRVPAGGRSQDTWELALPVDAVVFVVIWTGDGQAAGQLVPRILFLINCVNTTRHTRTHNPWILQAVQERHVFLNEERPCTHLWGRSVQSVHLRLWCRLERPENTFRLFFFQVITTPHHTHTHTLTDTHTRGDLILRPHRDASPHGPACSQVKVPTGIEVQEHTHTHTVLVREGWIWTLIFDKGFSRCVHLAR